MFNQSNESQSNGRSENGDVLPGAVNAQVTRAKLGGMFDSSAVIATAAMRGYDQAQAYGYARVGIEHLLYTIVEIPAVAYLLKQAGGSPVVLKRELNKGFREHRLASGASRIAPAIGQDIYEACGMISLECDLNPLASQSENLQIALTYLLRQVENSALADAALNACGAHRLVAMFGREGAEISAIGLDDDFLLSEETPASLLPPDDKDATPTPERKAPADHERTPDEILDDLDRDAGIAGGEAAERQSQGFSQAQPARRESRSPRNEDAQKAQKTREAVMACLRDIGEDAEAGRIDPVIGRDDYIEQVILCLQRRRKGGVLLHGEAGIGKTAIGEGVALALRNSQKYGELAKRPFYEVSMPSLMAGTRYRGDYEEKVKALIDFAREERAILFIDEIHLIMGTGSTQSGMDAANMFKPALARGEITIIGATTTLEMRALRRDAAIMRRFEAILVREPSREETVEIINRAAPSYLEFHGVGMAEGIPEMICRMTDLYQPDKRFPDKAFDLLDMACVVARDSGRFDEEKTILTQEHVEAAADLSAIRRPKVPGAAMAQRLAKLEDCLNAEVFGQETVVTELVEKTTAASFGLSDQGAMLSVLLAGPKGSGRRGLVRSYAKHMKLEMLEFDGELIGARDVQMLLADELEIRPDLCMHMRNIDRAPAEVHALLAEIIISGCLRTVDGRVSSCRGLVVMVSVDHDVETETVAIGFQRENGDPSKGLSRKLMPALLEQLGLPLILNRPGIESRKAAIKAEVARLQDRLMNVGITIELSKGALDEMAGADGSVEAAANLAAKRMMGEVTRAMASGKRGVLVIEPSEG